MGRCRRRRRRRPGRYSAGCRNRGGARRAGRDSYYSGVGRLGVERLDGDGESLLSGSVSGDDSTPAAAGSLDSESGKIILLNCAQPTPRSHATRPAQ